MLAFGNEHFHDFVSRDAVLHKNKYYVFRKLDRVCAGYGVTKHLYDEEIA